MEKACLSIKKRIEACESLRSPILDQTDYGEANCGTKIEFTSAQWFSWAFSQKSPTFLDGKTAWEFPKEKIIVGNNLSSYPVLNRSYWWV